MKNNKLIFISVFTLLILGFFFSFNSSQAAISPNPNPVPTNIDYTKIGTFNYSDNTGRTIGSYTTFMSGNGVDYITGVFRNDGTNSNLIGLIKTDPSGNHTSYSVDPISAQNEAALRAAMNQVGGTGAYDNYLTSLLIKLIDQNQNALNSFSNPPPGIPPSDCIQWPTWNAFQINPEICIARFVANPMLWLSSRILWLAGLIFNFTLNWSLKIKDLVDNTRVVATGWKILRDIANLCFIFILLAIAIGTILRIDSYDVRKLLAKVIIVAILLNFSLFLTKVVVDASNILALQFYSRIAPNPNNLDGGVSAAFIEGLGLQGVYKAGSQNTQDSSKDFVANEAKTKNVIFIGILGSALILVTAFVLLVGVILFIIRTVVLMAIMILSPLAFLASILPNTAGYFKHWYTSLFKQAFFAPLFLIMIYIVFAAINEKQFNPTGGPAANFSNLLAGSESATSVIYSFILLIGLMLASLIISKTLGAYGGELARNWAGKASFGIAGWTGRQSAGRAFEHIARRTDGSERDWFRRAKNAGIFQRRLAGLVDRGAKGSYDIRKTGVGQAADKFSGGLGTPGGEGGYAKTAKEKADRMEKRKFEEKQIRLRTALATGNDAVIQNALTDFNGKEFSELDRSLLNDERVIRNASYGHIKAVTDDKNDKVDQRTKDRIKQLRLGDLEKGVQAGNATQIESALDNLSDTEKANLPEHLINNRQVYRHFDKDVREKIEKSDDVTPATKSRMVDQRKAHFIEELGKATPDHKLIDDISKNMRGRELYDAITSAGGSMTDPNVVRHLTEEQLKQLEKTGLSPADRQTIGNMIRGWRGMPAATGGGRNHPALKYVTAGGPIRGGGTVSVGEGYNNWS